MRLHVIPTPFYAANCVIIVPDGSTTACVVDPSAGVIDTIARILADEERTVGAVLCTHGHADHVWEAAAAASLNEDDSQVPVYIPGPDRYRMDDPLAHTPAPPQITAMLGEWRKPEDLRDFPAGSVELLEGLWMKMVPAPGHTEGSAVFIGHCDITVVVDGREVISSTTPVPWALSGDVIFAGSVGRTDLPGGDETQMRHSLRTISNALDPQTFMIPGHGPVTTLAEEIATNPYLSRARQIG